MKLEKLLPILPMLALILGVLYVQSRQYNTGAVLSSVLTGEGEESVGKVCTTPDVYTKLGESAWCKTGAVTDIQGKNGTWSWSCLVNNQEYPCNFTETKNYHPMKIR